jgi:hypothetical protein
VDRLLIDDIFLFVSLIVGMGCLTGIIVTFLKRRSKPSLSADMSSRLDDIANRLNRLEGAVDTVAVEVERISEAQRFTAKVLAERSGNPALADRGRGGPVSQH